MLKGRWVKNVTIRMKRIKNAELFSSPFAPLPTVLSGMCRALKRRHSSAENCILRNTMAVRHAKNVMSHAGSSCVGVSAWQ